MDYLGDNAGLGLTSEQTDKVLQFQDLTGIEDISICRDVLQRHQWNLEVAVQEQLNIREGRPSLYATETRPPAVVSDHFGQHVFYTPPTDGSGSGLRGFISNFINFVWTFCYNTIITLLQLGRRFIRADSRTAITNPLEDVLDFIRVYEEKYSEVHPVFYQGTYSQVLNDAKHELKFLLIYLHNDNAVDTGLFCRNTLSNTDVITYINTNFLFWGCSAKSGEGYKVCQLFRPGHYPYLAVVVLKDNRMTIVSRMEGYCDHNVLLQRLATVVAEFEINLIQARTDRVEASLNRSLRAHQDEAFLESLRADQEKERRRQEERDAVEAEQRRIEEEALAEQERRQSIAQEKMNSVHKVPSEPDPTHPDVVHVVFKLPSGQRLERRFLKTHSLEAIFYFVFCHPNAPDSFEITTNFPKRVLQCLPNTRLDQIQTLEEAGLKNREVLFINDLDA
ncbi:hypothetical protein RN001_013957 [Aquatica leii]|uniref:UBX domain-containing protein n=1 Tax=Aquatica leii TaxID=1421715 RepID=A0AAN7PSF0_9COLE|nr:hypothetical protein RN001_013957 [Aquatica leii]